MKITGLTIIRNAVINDYPIVEAIESVLPVVDEMIVTIDRGTDDTEALIRSIGSPKINIYFTEWDMNLREGGQVLAVETNKALQYVSADTDWVFYIQADEVLHEKYIPAILAAAKKYKDDKAVDGLLFRYKHFYGTYDFVGDSRRWYDCETRIIRNDKSIRSYRDAQGFRRGEEKISVAAIDAAIYHYGWVKSPEQMKKKMKDVSHFWVKDDAELEAARSSPDFWDFNEFDSLEKFTGTHPAVLQQRIQQKNWHLDLDISRKKFSLKDKLLYWVEKLTGKRLFAFSNHRVVRKG